MHGEFETIDPAALPDNPFELIGEKWMLITAGSRKGFNTMTASWGGMGSFGPGRSVSASFVRAGTRTLHGGRGVLYPLLLR